MSEVRLSPIGGWGIFAARMVSALALGARAHGEVAMGLPRRLPEVYDQRLAEAGATFPLLLLAPKWLLLLSSWSTAARSRLTH